MSLKFKYFYINRLGGILLSHYINYMSLKFKYFYIVCLGKGERSIPPKRLM